MKKIIYSIVLLSLSLFLTLPLHAQVSEGGTPPSFSYESDIKQLSKAAAQGLSVPFDVNTLKEEDKIRESYGHPPRAIKLIPVDMTMENSGEWSTLPNGQRIWRLMISAPGAIATMLTYDEFIIPEGGKLFIYSPDHSRVLGAYTSISNPKREEFATELIGGDQLILEYVEPSLNDLKNAQAQSMSTMVSKFDASNSNDFKTNSANSQEPRIKITGVGYGYNHMTLTGNGIVNIVWKSGDCMVNVNCPEGANWQDEKKGVVRILTQDNEGGYLLCSGTMILNTAKDFSPLFLSAFHCYQGFTPALMNQSIYYFNYESPGCQSEKGYDPDPYNTQTVVGATALVEIPLDGGSDGMLLKLNGTIPRSYGAYYNGWDRSNVGATSGVGIHHPQGDIKKISTFKTPAVSTTASMNSGERGAPNAHWQIIFAATENGHGVTEGGSSGSPLFDQNKRVVGTLTGGASSCANPTGRNLYGKLWYHWDQGYQKMNQYLDPGNTGLTYVDGSYPVAAANFHASKTTLYASESITFTDQSYDATTYAWTFNGGTPGSFTGKTPPPILYNTPGTYNATLVINKGAENERSRTQLITVIQKESICPATLEIGTSTTNTAQFPLGAMQRQTFSSAIYTAAELNAPKGGVIKTIGWNAGSSAANRTRTIMVYLKEVNETTLTSKKWNEEIASATLVYQSQSSGNWVTEKGWVNLTLSTPFQYSGAKNLKVLVRVYTTENTNFQNSDCYYTEATDAHMQWTTTGAAIPALDGTVNNNRPNIKLNMDIACGTTQPTADFYTGAGTTLFSEGFDNTAFPPTGWTLEKPGSSPSIWRNADINFKSINPDDVYSATIAYDDNNVVNSWLKSPGVSIENSSIIEFYAYYSGAYLSGGALNFFVSKDNGVTWEQKWTTGNANTDVTAPLWSKHSIDLSEYTGKTVKFAWQYYGRGGDGVGLDGIKVFATTDKITINEGETVLFTDHSIGPPVLWQWTLPGSETASSSLTDVTARYMTAGTYNASLKVSNNIGSDTKTVENSVEVLVHTPKANFASSAINGFTMRSNYGRFLPLSGGTVSFKDVSGHYPKSWEWTLSGATPSSATTQNTEAIYPGGVNSYPVTFKATNTAGNDVLTVSDYIKVGGTAEIWNMPQGETGTEIYTVNGPQNFMTGTNSFYSRISERFENAAPGEISKVRIFGRAISGNRSISVAIYTDNGGLPGTQIGSTVLVNTNSFSSTSSYVTVNFPQPIGVQGSFHVVIGNLTYSGGSSFVIPSSTPSLEKNTAYLYYDAVGYWMSYTELLSDVSSTVNISLNVVPEFTYTTAALTSTGSFKRKNVDPTTGNITFTSTGHGWVASASSWITLSSPSGTIGMDGSGSLTFTCQENPTTSIRKGSVTVNVAGTPLVIPVTQGGSYPRNTKAVFAEDTKGIQLTWNTATASAPAEANAEQLADVPNTATRTSTTQWDLRSNVIEQSSSDNQAVPTAAEEVKLRWDKGGNASSFGSSQGGRVEAAIRFNPSDLLAYNMSKIKAVEFYPSAAGNNMVIRIRKDGAIIHTQPISGVTPGQFNRINLTTELFLDASASWMISYAFDQSVGQENYVVGCDRGPAVRDKGDLISLNGSAFESAAAAGFNVNWNIALVIEQEIILPTKYAIYRDQTLLADNLSEMTYLDRTAQMGDHCYSFSAIYNGDPEFTSTISPEICAFSKSVITVIADQKTKTENDANPTFTGKVTGRAVNGDTQTTLEQMVSYTCAATDASPAGTYAIIPMINNLSPDLYSFTVTDAILTVNVYPIEVTTQPVSGKICEGAAYTFSVAATGIELSYQWQKQQGNSWQNINGANTVNYTIAAGTPAQAGSYRVVISGRSTRVISEVVTLTVGLPESTIVVFLWDDVPSINCNPATNGGYSFTSFQWYKNGVAIPRATLAYLQIEDFSATYHCEMMTNDHRPLSVCSLTLHATGNNNLLAYPNPLQSGEALTVKLENAPNGSKINIYTLSGDLVKGNLPLTGNETSIDTGNLAPGLYILQAITPEGIKQTTKLLVK